MLKTDVCIVGAGPGGATTALKLSHLNIPCILVDKAVFPRDKICGDAISGKSMTILHRIDPAIMERFQAAVHERTEVWGIRFVSPDVHILDVPFRVNYDPVNDPKQGFVSKRIDFDQRLIEEVKQRENVTLFEGVAIEEYEKTETGYRISSKDKSLVIETRLLIIANGAHSSFSRHHAGLVKDEKHHAGAVRAYYRNVAGMHPDGFIELHFLKDITPGYLWVFPLPGGYANVGLGMRSDYVSKRRFNLTKSMQELLENSPHLRDRFKNAEMIGKISGYGLPLGSKKQRISGNHFMLIGDAGHLIDPLTGEGIGNAIYSGFIAAEQAQKCLEAGDFSAKFMEAYDVRVTRVLGKEMEVSYRLQQIMAHPWLVNLLAKWISRSRVTIEVISRMYTDLSLRGKALTPLFWIRQLLSRVVLKAGMDVIKGRRTV
jgi:geranylgeranyl reductase family protein